MSMHTLQHIVEFVNKYKGSRAFLGWKDDEIMKAIILGVRNGTYMYASEPSGEIVGVVYGWLIPEKNVYYLENMITTKPWVMREFIQTMMQKWPGYHVEALVRGKLKILTLDKLKRLSK